MVSAVATAAGRLDPALAGRASARGPSPNVRIKKVESMRFIVLTFNTGSKPSRLLHNPSVPIKWQRSTAYFLTSFGCNHFVAGQSIFIAGITFRWGTKEPCCSCHPSIGIFGTGGGKSVAPDLVHKHMARMPASGTNRIRTPHSKRQASPVVNPIG